MAVITLQFGQCGNQMGFDLLSLIFKDLQVTNHGVGVKKNQEYVSESVDKIFRTSSKDQNKLTARSLLVDTENKVLENILCGNAKRGWCYDKNNVLKGHGGSANNWAYGHYSRGPELIETFMDLLRKEVEDCDRISLLLGLLSSAGGTGSGLGSFIAETIRDEYPRKTLANVVILPFCKGEIAVQSYNTLFTLSSLLSVSDAIIVIRNDYLHHACTFQLNIQNANLSDLNYFGMQQLASLFQGKHDVNELLTDLTPHPSYKCLTLDSSPKLPVSSLKFEGVIGWEALAKDAVRSMKKRRSTEFKDSKIASVANVIITRGLRTVETDSVVGHFNTMLNFPKWVLRQYQFNNYHEDRKFLYFDKYITWASNCSDVYWPLNTVFEKARKLFSYRAYVHQYKMYNVQEQDFLESFTRVGSVVNSYNNIKIFS